MKEETMGKRLIEIGSSIQLLVKHVEALQKVHEIMENWQARRYKFQLEEALRGSFAISAELKINLAAERCCVVVRLRPGRLGVTGEANKIGKALGVVVEEHPFENTFASTVWHEMPIAFCHETDIFACAED